MNTGSALLTFRIGPVHTFIAQARRVADLWTGSEVLSQLITVAIKVVLWLEGGSMIFPFVDKPAEGEAKIPRGLPNRFVARVPRASAEDTARSMEAAVRAEWNRLVTAAVGILGGYGFKISDRIWTSSAAPGQLRQTDHVLQISWSWVDEAEGYAAASLAGARRFSAARRFGAFAQIDERDEKCAVCGERTALPDGDRQTVRDAWKAAEDRADRPQSVDRAFFRFGQTRLCLVCATKRFFPRIERRMEGWFSDFRFFEPSEEDHYFALVKVDGDHMGEVLSRDADHVGEGQVEVLHRKVSTALSDFADSLRSNNSACLKTKALEGLTTIGKPPQLIYAGGDDVLLVCDPRDALAIASALHAKYERELGGLRSLLVGEADKAFTLSGAVLFAHTKHPAGLLFRDLEDLLKRKAKAEAGRDAVALRLVKRSGVPVEVAMKWGELGKFEKLVDLLREGEVSSKLTYHLRKDEATLQDVFQGSEDRWRGWLADRVSRSGGRSETADSLVAQILPLFLSQRSQAIRIARFLGHEVHDWQERDEPLEVTA